MYSTGAGSRKLNGFQVSEQLFFIGGMMQQIGSYSVAGLVPVPVEEAAQLRLAGTLFYCYR